MKTFSSKVKGKRVNSGVKGKEDIDGKLSVRALKDIQKGAGLWTPPNTISYNRGGHYKGGQGRGAGKGRPDFHNTSRQFLAWSQSRVRI